MKFVQSSEAQFETPAEVESALAGNVAAPIDGLLFLVWRGYDKILFLSSTYCVPSRLDFVRVVFLSIFKTLVIHSADF